MAKIDVVSSSLVRMALATNSVTISRMDLTPWDLRLLALYPIQKGIVFHHPQFHKSMADHLQNALSRTLDYFPPLAGRLSAVHYDDNSTGFFVDCNNAGVEFTYAVAAAVSVSDILEPKYIPKMVSSYLFPLNDTRNYEGVSKPLFGVQITELIDGYFIGCSANHAVVDGNSFWHFMNCWSEISRGSETISKYPSFDRRFPSNWVTGNRLISIPDFYQKVSNIVSDCSVMSERFFHFSKDCVAKLKARANSEAGTDKLSSLQSVIAHLWVSVIRCRIGEKGQSKLVVAIGARTRIPLAEGYFGNAVHIGVVSCGVEEMECSGLGFVAGKINETVREQSREVAIMKSVEDWVKNPVLVSMGKKFDFLISNSPRYNVYGNDFGWGKPIAVRSGKGQKFDGKFTVYPAAEAGGIDVEVCLRLETLQALEKDVHFLHPLPL